MSAGMFSVRRLFEVSDDSMSDRVWSVIAQVSHDAGYGAHGPRNRFSRAVERQAVTLVVKTLRMLGSDPHRIFLRTANELSSPAQDALERLAGDPDVWDPAGVFMKLGDGSIISIPNPDHLDQDDHPLEGADLYVFRPSDPEWRFVVEGVDHETFTLIFDVLRHTLGVRDPWEGRRTVESHPHDDDPHSCDRCGADWTYSQTPTCPECGWDGADPDDQNDPPW